MIELARPGDYIDTELGYEPVDVPGEHFVFNNGKGVVCSFGLVKVWHGYTRAYFSWNDDGYNNRLSIIREIKRLLLERGRLYRRIDATVRCDFSRGIDFLEMLGFEFEGVMDNYDPVDWSSHYIYRYEGKECPPES